MADKERNFSTAAENGSPDVTIKVTDEQLSQASAKAKEALQQLRQYAFNDDDEDMLSETRSSISSTSIGGFVNFLHRNFLPDFPDRDITEATVLLDNTRNDLNAKTEEEIDTTQADYNLFPKLNEACDVKDAFAGGGQGIISRAVDKVLHRSIAIKSLRKEILDKAALREAFVNEAMITAQLEHPAIIPIHGLFGDDENGIHQAMKLVKGHTLKDELQRFIQLRKKVGTKISQGVMNRLFNERIVMLLRVCDAVAYAHSRNIIHCDLKPENIMIGEYGEIYVMDWGLARRFRDDNGKILPANSGAPLDGTPRYMPAETFMGKPRDERTDIFALGLILFEMITLRHGYNGKSIQEVIKKIKNGDRLPIVNRFGYDLNPDLVAIVDKATAYLPEERYQHVTDFTEDLKRYLAGMAVNARPENFIGKFFRGIKRYSRTLVLLTLISWVISGIFIQRHLHNLHEQTSQALEDERAYTEQQRNDIRQLEFEHHLTNMDSQVIRSAISLSNTLVDLASDLRNISMNAGILLTSPNIDAGLVSDDVANPFIPYRQITQQNGVFSPVYNDYIKPDACAYQVPDGQEHEQIAEELARLRPIAPALQNLVLNSNDLLQGNSTNDQTFAMVQEGILIRRAYLAVEDSHLHLAYPGSGKYRSDYDNHTRPWYYYAKSQAIGKFQAQSRNSGENLPLLKPIWGKPYLDQSNSDDNKKQQVLTCSMPIVSPDQKTFLGVVAFDLFFETFADQLRNDGNGHDDEIVAKYLCFGDGTILCHVPVHPISQESLSDGEVEERLRKKLSFLFSPKLEHLAGGYGHFKSQENHVWIYYHYAYIPVLNLYLIEKTREDLIIQAMKDQEKENQRAIQASIAAPPDTTSLEVEETATADEE